MKKIHVVLIVVIAVMVGVIVTLMFNTSTFGTFADAEGLSPEDEFRVVGTLDKSKPIMYDAKVDPNYCEFFLLDKKGISKKVVLHQSKPRDLEKSGAGDEIVVNGALINNAFHVGPNGIQLKCPSKYNKGTPMETAGK
jgi:cytochrome c-type biogenesis protein CcmE